jgi:peptide/nickel transport system permease protein
MTFPRLALGRVLMALFTLLLVSAIIFLMLEVLPGDVAIRILGREANPEAILNLRAQLGLDRPALERYLSWLGGIVLHLDFGEAVTSNRPITEILAPRILNTLYLAGAAFTLYVPLAIVPAMIQAIHRDRAVDHVISAITLALLSTPDFLLATFLLILFVIEFPLFPAVSIVDEESSFTEYARALVLPSVTLALVMAVYAVRMLRDNLIEVLDSEYVRMAELKGLPRRKVLLRHALPNALIPTLNITALNLAYIIGGVVVVEKLFSYPGFGSLLVDSLQLRDLPLVEATVLVAAAVYIFANLLADLGAMLLNPRLRGELA